MAEKSSKSVPVTAKRKPRAVKAAPVVAEEPVVHHHAPQDRHPRTGRHWHVMMPVAAGVLGLVVGLGMLLAVAGAVQNQRNASVPEAVAPLVYGPQAQVATNLYHVNLVGGVRVVANEPVFKPDPASDIVVVKLSITNSTNALQHFLPSIHTYIRDEEGQTYAMHPTVTVTDPLPAADLQAGETVSGELSYAVPKNVKNFRLYVDPYWDRMAPVVFRLSR